MKSLHHTHGPLARFTGALLLVALIGGGLGWCLRHLTGPKSAAAPAVPGEMSRSASGSANSGSLSLAPTEDPVVVRKRVANITKRLSTADTDDMVEMIERIGAITQMTDAEVRLAWNQLSAQSPTKTFGGSLTAMYLWSRMQRMGEKVAVPEGWGMEEYKKAVESENARRNIDQVLKRLEAGGPVSDTERRVAFTQAIRSDPVNAVKLMCRVSKPGDYFGDAAFLTDAMTRPESRATVMAEVRKWQGKDGDLPGVVSYLARNWINRDPASVEQWLQEPEQADIKEAAMNEIINARTMENAGDAWAWCQSSALSEERRRYTLGYSSQHLANEQPEEGMKLIADLKDPEDRREVIGKFGPILAGGDFDQWKQWRDTLSPGDQDIANESAFHVWAREDVASAVQWLNKQSSGPARDQMIMTLISVYAATDPKNAVEWIRTIPEANRRRAAVTAALAHVGFEDLNRTRIILSGLAAN